MEDGYYMEEQAIKFEEKLKTLVNMGRKKKNTLEIQEINDVFSDMELEAEQMDKVFEKTSLISWISRTFFFFFPILTNVFNFSSNLIACSSM